MCKIYNSVGCLRVINSHLKIHNINDFKSLEELINFQKSYSSKRLQIISENEFIINNEKIALNSEIILLNNSIKIKKDQVEQQLRSDIEKLRRQLENITSADINWIKEFVNYFKRNSLKTMIRINELSLNSKVKYSVRNSSKILEQKNNRFLYIDCNFRDAVNESSQSELKNIDRIKSVIDEISNSIVGALGEQKVVEELEYLSDEYILINDFNCSFYKPIYYRKENDYIKSVQIDHILIAPSGIFLIETKNWNKNSLNNPILRSPVHQIHRANFTLFRIVSELTLNHFWGTRKIPIRNLIVMINQKPIEEFQYVKILTLKELLGYINYFKPCFSQKETEKIAHHLLNKINQKTEKIIIM